MSDYLLQFSVIDGMSFVQPTARVGYVSISGLSPDDAVRRFRRMHPELEFVDLQVIGREDGGTVALFLSD